MLQDFSPNTAKPQKKKKDTKSGIAFFFFKKHSPVPELFDHLIKCGHFQSTKSHSSNMNLSKQKKKKKQRQNKTKRIIKAFNITPVTVKFSGHVGWLLGH